MTKDHIQLIQEKFSFIKEHLTEDPFKLSLKYASDVDKRVLIDQIQSRQKIRKKLPDWYTNERLIFPSALSLEQSSSQATASLKAQLISGNHLMDITGGLGIDCYYLSKSFAKTSYIEVDENLASSALYNFNALNAGIEVIHADGPSTLTTSGADVVYVDPYRRDHSKNKVVDLKDCIPDVTEMISLLTKDGRKTLLKTSPMLSIPPALAQLNMVSEIWVISHKNECKELLFLLEETHNNIKVKTFDINSESINAFEFSYPEILSTKCSIGEIQNYLYEPNASIMKAQGQDILGQSQGLTKLHPNTNIFTSKKAAFPFQGKVFKVKEIHKPYDKKLKKRRFNVISRNFPEKANEIEQKLRLKPAKNDYLIALRAHDGSYKFVVGELYVGPE